MSALKGTILIQGTTVCYAIQVVSVAQVEMLVRFANQDFIYRLESV